MRLRSRLLLLASPLLGWVGRALAQPTSHTQATEPPGSQEAAEVQVGAGTQGDVTNGSSGPQKRQDKEQGKDKSQAGAGEPTRNDRSAQPGALGNRAPSGSAAQRAASSDSKGGR